MNFFTQLATLGQGMDIVLRVKGKNGMLTVSVEPQHANVSKLKPLVLTGTPEEMDDGFIGQFDGAVTVARGLSSNLEEVKKDAADLASSTEKQASSKKEAPKKDEPEKAKAPVKKDKAGKEKPASKKVKPTAPIPATPDIFSMPPPAPESEEKTNEQVDEELSNEPSASEKTE